MNGMQLHICFTDSDGVQRKVLWRIVRLYPWYSTQRLLGWYGKCTEEASVQKSIGDERLTNCVGIKSGILQGCVMSGFLVLLVYRVMGKALEVRNSGIRWRFTEKLKDLEFADDLTLLLSTRTHAS